MKNKHSTTSIDFIKSQVNLFYQDLLKTIFATLITFGLLVGIYYYLLYNG